MVSEKLAKKVIFLIFVISGCFLLSLSFIYAEELVSECEECKVDYIPGVTKDMEALIVTDKNCSFCDSKIPRKLLKSKFPGISFVVVDYKSKQAKKLIDQYEVKTLPCFFVDPLVKDEKIFDKVKFIFEDGKDGKLLLRKELSGICVYLDRKEINKKVDLFLDFYEEAASEILDDLINFSKEVKISLDIHFIISKDKKIGYPKEEVRVALAISELYPNGASNYIYRRIKDIASSSWIDTVEKEGLDYKKIRDLMTSSLIYQLVDKNQELVEDLMIRDGNVILINNNKIFKVFNIDKEELKSFFKGE